MFLEEFRFKLKRIISRSEFTRKFVNNIKSFIYIHGRNLSCDNLVERHFKFWSDRNHPNYEAFANAVNALGGKPAVIVETGTSAWGTDSTRLWDQYVRVFGGELWTVDIRPEAGLRLKNQVSRDTNVIVQDSVEFLKDCNFGNANLYFLDSWDVDWSDSYPSALHGKNEFEAIRQNLRSGDLILIDDTPINAKFLPPEYEEACQSYVSARNAMPGKGGLVVAEIAEDERFTVLFHEYAVLIEYQEFLIKNEKLSG
jgi:hypothetical protein